MTRAYRSRDATRSASRQLVGGGWWPGGRSSYQTRHSPGGGNWPGGIPCSRYRPSRSCATAGLARNADNINVAVRLRMITTPDEEFGKNGTSRFSAGISVGPVLLSPQTDGSVTLNHPVRDHRNETDQLV